MNLKPPSTPILEFFVFGVKMSRENGNAAGVTAIAKRVKARVFDLSALMKELNNHGIPGIVGRKKQEGGCFLKCILPSIPRFPWTLFPDT